MSEPILKKGSTDPAVRDLQEALKALGYDPGPVDGVFATKTENAVKAFQQAREITVDGIVGLPGSTSTRPIRASRCCAMARPACRSVGCKAG
jgi:peptidoglycan hydrolase-like protein with peptidoglycan-binding domain